MGIVISGHLGGHLLFGGAHSFAMLADGQTQRFTQVLEKMPAVGDLRSIGCTATGALSIDLGTRDNLDARMAFQP
ncbi:hypothetical protein MPL3365_550003 [Mesorhizobium plurifarium]|uniref:Uncharacterized protein n=1 Tax=Mesorhizobium plurifarium TaxID=69974 RepID=A0A090GGD2_MESPL|nr:hypothetical protein MPL3365_550003 [Mesorhizobium plurifarium]